MWKAIFVGAIPFGCHRSPFLSLISFKQKEYLSSTLSFSSLSTWFGRSKHDSTKPAAVPVSYPSSSEHVLVGVTWLNLFISQSPEKNLNVLFGIFRLHLEKGFGGHTLHFTTRRENMAHRDTDEPKTKQSTMPKKIGTHNGTFHCDEALACFLIQMLPEYIDSTIVRTRDPSKLAECDIVVDVGGVYDEKKFRFDHHQRTFNENMNSLNADYKWVTKLSSAGLIYYHFGHRILEQILQLDPKNPAIVDIVFRKIYENLIEEIDGIDNGINQTDEKPKYSISSGISSRIKRLNPSWNDDNYDEEALFRKAMELVGSEFVDRVLFYKESWLPARKIIVKALDDRKKVDESGEILVLTSGGCPWKDHLLTLEEEKEITPNIKYVLYADQASNWRVQCVPLHSEGFSNRLSLPEEWRGIRDDELSKKSGIKGCIFVHASGFIGGNKTYDGALEMAKIALKNKKEM